MAADHCCTHGSSVVALERDMLDEVLREDVVVPAADCLGRRHLRPARKNARAQCFVATALTDASG